MVYSCQEERGPQVCVLSEHGQRSSGFLATELLVDGWYQRDLVVSDPSGCALLNGSVWMVEVGIVAGLAAAGPAVPRSVF